MESIPPVTPESGQLGPLLGSVVKVICISDAPDYDQPWQTSGPTQCAGSGSIIRTARGLRILTNAHCVENHVFVEVRRYGSARKYVAGVDAIGHECDLALLQVEEEEFYDNVIPLPLGDLPHLGERVAVCGYPIGGERLSITQGSVSRIELVHYAQSQRRLLAVQIDAAINDGNSGGPVIKNGHLIGVAFQTLDGAERIGHVIAMPVIEHFLKDVEDGVYDGFPGLGVVIQPLESAAHRRSLGLPPERDEGVVVARIIYGSSAWGVLEEQDVLLAVEGVPVASDGTAPLREGELVDFTYLVNLHQTGDPLKLRVWRRGRETDLEIELQPPQYLVAESRYEVRPSYYIFGGLLFVPLTRDYLRTYPEPWWQTAPRHLMTLYERGICTEDRTEAVILQKVLADRVNLGYHEYESLLIEKVQGEKLRDLAHLVSLIEDSEDEFVIFTADTGLEVVMDRTQALERRREILDRFGIPRYCSADLNP